MPDPLKQVLRLVAEGRLSAADAAQLIDALGETGSVGGADGPEAGPSRSGAAATSPTGSPTSLRIEITEDGRKVVNLRIPVSLGRLALDRVPGLTGSNADMIRRALAEGRIGQLLTIDDKDGGVRIALE